MFYENILYASGLAQVYKKSSSNLVIMEADMNKDKEHEILFDMLKKAVTPFDCVKAGMERLKSEGFDEINYTDDWKLLFCFRSPDFHEQQELSENYVPLHDVHKM